MITEPWGAGARAASAPMPRDLGATQLPTDRLPELIEGPDRAAIIAALERLPTSAVVTSPWLRYALGSVMALRGQEEAFEWLTGALVASRTEPRLFARVTAELGILHLSRAEAATARALLTWATGIAGRSADHSPDLLRLRAHLAYEAGDPAGALTHAERAVALSERALTPSTLIDALHIIAAAEALRDPIRAVELARFCLRVALAERLHPTFALPVRCVLGFAMVAIGAPGLARREFDETLATAMGAGATRARLAAALGSAIVAELEGRLPEAARKTDDLIAVAHDTGIAQELNRATVYRQWLRLKAGGLDTPSAADTPIRSAADRRSWRILRSIASARAGAPGAPRVLADLAHQAAQAQRNTEAVALYLHAATHELALGRVGLARTRAAEACDLASNRGIRTSPWWWDASLVDAALRLNSDGAARQFVPPIESSHAPRVRVRTGGEILVDGVAAAELWRIGKTGPRVLRRFFSSLLEVHPRSLERDALCDLLWPESEGDRAVRNLYAATADLKRALSRVPGVRLEVGHGRYALDLGSCIEFEDAARA